MRPFGIFSKYALSGHIVAVFFFLLALYFPLFLHLDSQGLAHWDEAHNAVNAIEMEQHGHYLRRYFNGQPDSWETKPPLLIWLQVFSFKLLGHTELAVRLPATLAALGSVLLIALFYKKVIRLPLAGALSALALVCSAGFIRPHVARTGDHDALMIYWMLAGLFTFLGYLHFQSRRRQMLVLFTTSLILGVMSKSIAALLFLPGYFLYALLSGRVLKILKDRDIYIAAMGFVAVVGSYYWTVEYYYPGYLELVWNNELLPRYLNAAKDQTYHVPDNRWIYIKLLVSRHFSYFIFLLPLSGWFLYRAKTYPLLGRFSLLLAVVAISFLFIISMGTFNSWYDAPVIPLLAMLCGSGLALAWMNLHKYVRNAPKWLVGLLLVFAVFGYPYYRIVEKSYHSFPNQDNYGEFLHHLKAKRPELRNLFVYYEVRNSAYLFYEKVYRWHYGYQLESCGVAGPLIQCEPGPQAGQHVLICRPQYQKAFERHFDSKLLEGFDQCVLYRMIRKRGKPTVVAPTPK